MPTDIPPSAQKPHADFERKKAEFERAIEKMVSSGKIASLGAAILGLEDRTQGTVFHPTFEKVLVDTYKAYLLAHFSSRISVKADGDTKRAAEEQARTHVQLLMAEEIAKFRGDTKMKERAEGLLTSIDVLLADIGRATDGVTRILVEAEKFKNLDFIKGVTESKALVLVDGEGELGRLVPTFEEYRAKLSAAREAIHKAVNDTAPGGDELVAAVETAYRVMGQYFPDRGRLSMAIADAYKDMTVTINQKLLDAYIYGHSDAVSNLKGAKEIAEKGVSITETVLKKSTYSGFFVRLAEFVNAVGNKAATEAAVKAGAEKFKKDRAPGSLFDAYGEDPTLLFTRLQDNQLAALDILISGIGFTMSGPLTLAPGAGDVVMQVFDLVTTAVKAIVKGILKRRADGALEEIKKLAIPRQAEGEPSFWEAAEKFWDARCQDISDELTRQLQIEIDKSVTATVLSADTAVGLAQAAYTPGGDDESRGTKFDPVALVSLLEGWIIEPVVNWALGFVEIKPAQFFTGDDLALILTGINRAQWPPSFVLQQTLVKSPLPAQVDTDTYADAVPAEINGHPVVRTDASRSTLDGDPATHVVYAALKLQGVTVWGNWRPGTKEWQARDIERDSFAGWSDITVVGRDSIKENNTEVKGVWQAIVSPENNYTYIGFKTDGGDWRLGHYMDLPKGPRMPEYFLGTQTAQFWVTQDIGDHFRV